MSKLDLDKELKEWSKRREAELPPITDEWVKDLSARLGKPLPETAEPAAPILLMQRQLRRTRLALAAAVAIVIGLGAFLLMQQTPTDAPEVAKGDQQPPAGLSPDDLAELSLVANEAEKLFPEGIRWISKVNGEVSMGIDNPRRLSSDATRLVVSYSVRRKAAGGAWEVVDRHDIITYADEPVNLGAEQPIKVWCHLVEGNQAALSLDVRFQVEGRSLSVTAETLQALGEPEVVHTDEIGGVSYEIVQSVYPI